MSQHQSSNPNNNIFQYFLFFSSKNSFQFQLTKHIFDFKNARKLFFFSLYSQKQVFENRKQKLLPSLTYISFILPLFYFLPIFYPFTFLLHQPNRPLSIHLLVTLSLSLSTPYTMGFSLIYTNVSSELAMIWVLLCQTSDSPFRIILGVRV